MEMDKIRSMNNPVWQKALLSASALLLLLPQMTQAAEKPDLLEEPVHIAQTVQLDPNAPLIPKSTDTVVNTDGLTLEQAKKYLAEMMLAQRAMMQQMSVLQARIEKTEVKATQAVQKADDLSAQVDDHSGTIDSLLQKPNISGYAEMGYRAYTHAPRTSEYLGANGKNGNTFDLRRVNLRTNVQFNEKATWYNEVEYEDAAKDEISIEESRFIYTHKPWLTFQAGLMIPQVTWTNVNHDGPTRKLVDRPLVDQFVIPSTYRDLGAGFTGVIPVLKRSAISYDFMVLNGLNDQYSADGTNPVSASVGYSGLRDLRANESEKNSHLLDNNRNKAIYSRLGYMPFPGLNIGVSGHFSKIDNADRRNLSIISGDIQYRYKRFGMLMEYATALFNRGGSQLRTNENGVAYGQFPSSLAGYYIEGSYDITPKWMAITAWNWVDLDQARSGNQMYRWSAGVRYNPFKRVYLKAEYQLTSPRYQFHKTGEERYSNAFLTQITFAF